MVDDLSRRVTARWLRLSAQQHQLHLYHLASDRPDIRDADVYDGFTPWSTMALRVPSGATGGVLRGISCVSATRCEASGWSYFGGTPTALIETYS